MPKEIKRSGLEYLYHEGDLYSIVLRSNYKSDSIDFFTPDSFSQQLGYLPHKKGNILKPHEHRINTKIINYTQEVLIIKEGLLRVNYYDLNHSLFLSELLNAGDIILLCCGGHGFEFLEDTVMIEIKQGPYTGVDDKQTFEGK